MRSSQHSTQYTLPFYGDRSASENRPRTAHAASSSSSASTVAIEEKETRLQQTALGATAEVGMNLFAQAPETTLARDDTGVSLAENTASDPPCAPQTHVRCTQDDILKTYPETRLDPLHASRPTRRPTFRLPTNFQSTSAEAGIHRLPSLGRRFSKSTKERMVDLKEGVSKTAGRMRRSSTPHTSAETQAQRYGSATSSRLPPASPTKRTARYQEDRPQKAGRKLLNLGDRKDTPAPPTGSGLSRPASRQLHTPFYYTMPGGENARKAAAAATSKAGPGFAAHGYGSPSEEAEDARGAHDLEVRRSRLGSLSSAADSGADLSSCYGSVDSYRDADGDVEMASTETVVQRPQALDFVSRLPEELAIEILGHLDLADLVSATLVNRQWQVLANDTSVWRQTFLRKFQRRIHTNPVPIQVGGVGCGRPNKPNQQYKRMYKARLQLEQNWRQGAAKAGKAIYLSGHTDSVYCVQFDEEKIITGSRDRTIRVWDINTFTCQRVIGGPNVKPVQGPKVLRTVDYPAFHLATASVNGTAYGDSIYHVPSDWHDASILCLQYDDEILVTGSSDSDLIVWDVKTYEPMRRLRQHTGGVLDVALDAEHIISCSKDSKIIVWDRKTMEPKGELIGHRGPVNAVQLRGKYLVSASGDGIARLWDLKQMKLIKEFSAKERGLAAVEFSEDMKYVLAGGNDTITYKFDTETGEEVQRFEGHSQLVRSLWLDSHNNRVVSGSYDLNLHVYDFVTGEKIWHAEEWTTSWMLAAKSDYRRIVATSQDGRILVIDFGLQKAVATDDGQPLPDVDLLRGIEKTNAIQWNNPWEVDRSEPERERDMNPQPRSRGQSQFITTMSPMDTTAVES